MYAHMCMCINPYVWMPACLHAFYVYMQECMRFRRYVCVCVCLCVVCMYVWIGDCVCMYVCMCVCMCVCLCMYVCMPVRMYACQYARMMTRYPSPKMVVALPDVYGLCASEMNTFGVILWIALHINEWISVEYVCGALYHNHTCIQRDRVIHSYTHNKTYIYTHIHHTHRQAYIHT